MDSLRPFIKFPEYPFVFCTVCQYACIANEVETHLRRHHRQMDKKARSKTVYEVKSIPGIIRSQERLRQYQLPEYVDNPIPFIQPPKPDGIRCNECAYVTRQAQGIQNHYRDIHHWVNDWKRVDNFRKTPRTERVVPWTAQVHCQRFFPSRAASGWFEVRSASIDVAEPSEEREVMDRVRQCHSIQEQRFKDAEKVAVIAEVDQKTETNGWLGRVGWSAHLAELEADKLYTMTNTAGEDENVLRHICDSLDRTMEGARATCRPGKVGLSTLFEINRREVQKKPTQPFDARMEDDSWLRYKDVWRKIICIWYRTQQQDETSRPPYQFTSTQQDAWDQLAQSARTREAIFQGEPVDEPSAAVSDTTMDGQCLEVMIAFLDHQIHEDDYQSAIISALAVLGIREDRGWHDPCDYTPVLSAVVKVARMFAVYRAHQQRAVDVKNTMRMRNVEERIAREMVPGMFPRVRKMVRTFMTRVGDGRSAQPGPMDWILETRTYGMHIRFNTTAGGSIDWHQDRVTYKRVGFDMGQLTEMMHGVVGEARELMAELAMAGPDGVSALPVIPWDQFEDDNSDDQVGYSFLRDTRNTWLDQGKGWVFRQLVRSDILQKEWISSDQGETHPYNNKAVQGYSKKVERFREKIWLAIHMISGQPARATEILTIRHQNTSNGGARNIFVSKGQVCFVTAYHKNFQQTGQAKIIHRFMPKAVGELLIWYLWLVLPFWQQVQGMVKGADQTSAFLWGEEIARVSQAAQDEGYSSDGEDSTGSTGGSASKALDDEGIGMPAEWKNWITERKWTSDRVRRIMQQDSERLMGARLNISIWRHVAIAISNRYLGSKYTRVTGDDGMGYEDEDGIDDEASDLQAGHGSYIAGMIYARELQQGLGGTALTREKFREASNKWHRFFGFDVDETSQTGRKRKRDVFESVREEVRFQRLERLRQVNVGGQLQQMMGEGTEFRGQQSSVIRAVITGTTPIIQIASTGEGKSLSFMLPAYCSPEGTTIVIVPLVALQDNMLARCEKMRIPAYAWKSRQGSPTASIVFVTPESAVTGGFGDFVRRLQKRGVLDRVVVDECHTLLDGRPKFRPKLSEVGATIQRWGVQRVFLTATLGPAEMEDFYRIAAIHPDPTRHVVFRSKTTRQNIQYRIIQVQARGQDQEREEDNEVYRVVQAWLKEHTGGKVIVYAGSIDRLKQIGTKFGCSMYYNKVDTTTGKKERLQTWIQGERLIVATNALGMGIDVPDIWLVVHAWMPKRIRDYVQESGRGGRDGRVSQAIVVCGPMRPCEEGEKSDRGKKGDEREEDTVQYVMMDRCRRITLDTCMDGRSDRVACEAGEERCDVCERNARQQEEEERQESQGLVAHDEARAAFERERREVRFQAWADNQQVMREAGTAEELGQYLEAWSDCCMACRMGDEPDTHSIGMCPFRRSRGYKEMMDFMQVMEKEIFEKKRLADFSGCFGCGLPFKVCNQWEPVDGDEGRYIRVAGRPCQYQGVLVRFYGAALSIFPHQVKEMCGQETMTTAFYHWAGRRVAKWGGMETNEMCRGFMAICRWVIED